jgi:hypothetical protein
MIQTFYIDRVLEKLSMASFASGIKLLPSWI